MPAGIPVEKKEKVVIDWSPIEKGAGMAPFSIHAHPTIKTP